MDTGDRESVGDGAEWRRLQAEQLTLRAALAATTDEDERDDLRHRLKEGQTAIARFEAGPSSSGGHRSNGADRPPSDPSPDGGDRSDGLLDALLTTGEGVRPAGAGRASGIARSGAGRAPLIAGLGVVGLVAIAALIAFAWPLSIGESEQAATIGSTDLADEVEQLEEVLGLLGLDEVMPELRGAVIFLTGSVADDAELQSAVGAAAALADEAEVDTSELSVGAGTSDAPVSPEQALRDATLQRELSRLLASTPLVFETGQVELSELQVRILNNVVALLLSYSDVSLRIVGYTDGLGEDDSNLALSVARADAVRGYLVSQGVDPDQLTTEGRGEATAGSSGALAGLERRVELEVASSGGPATSTGTLRIGVVAPSASNDLAFTQSMVDAVAVIADERGNVEVEVVDNTLIPEDVAAAIRGFASEDYDLVIAHGSQFETIVTEVAADFPAVAFAWGTAGEDVNLQNVYGYEVASEEGGYVLGAMAASISTSGVIGVVGPIEVGDAQRYIDGFQAGAEAERPGSSVGVTYTGSFSDVGLATEAAQAHRAAGADVMTGTSQLVVGAVNVAVAEDVPWFGNQADQRSLAPSLVVASQVYRWEAILRPIVADIEQGALAGRLFTADLANGGLAIELNPEYPLPEPVRQRMSTLVDDVASGSIDALPGS